MEYLEKDIQRLQPKDILQRAEWTHFYVVCDADKIVGCGQSVLIGVVMMKAVYLQSSFSLNIKEKGLAVK